MYRVSIELKKHEWKLGEREMLCTETRAEGEFFHSFFEHHSPATRGLRILLDLVLPTSRVVYQPINHSNLWSIA